MRPHRRILTVLWSVRDLLALCDVPVLPLVLVACAMRSLKPADRAGGCIGRAHAESCTCRYRSSVVMAPAVSSSSGNYGRRFSSHLLRAECSIVSLGTNFLLDWCWDRSLYSTWCPVARVLEFLYMPLTCRSTNGTIIVHSIVVALWCVLVIDGY